MTQEDGGDEQSTACGAQAKLTLSKLVLSMDYI
jgi:hypothetical protein